MNYRLLTAFHLVVRSIAVRAEAAGPRMMLMARRGCHIRRSCPTCFRPALPNYDRPLRFCSRGRATQICSSSEPIGTSHAGPVTRRSQSPTHLDGVEDAVDSILTRYRNEADGDGLDILGIPSRDREEVGVASNLERRLRGLANSGDCRRCWLQRKHCVCDICVPLEGERTGGIPNVNRLFLLTHHKEICLTVDTAKLILAAFPETSRLVVSGLGRESQPALDEMLGAVSDAVNSPPSHCWQTNDDTSAGNRFGKCLILFPTDDALTFNEEIKEEIVAKSDAMMHRMNEEGLRNIDKGWDVIVIDGTWQQARKIHAKYLEEFIGGCLYRVQLSSDAVKELDASNFDGGMSASGHVDASGSIVSRGHQLRRHPIKWREIGTLEATRLLLNDMHSGGQFEEQSKAMAYYLEIGNDAARRQLGPPRKRVIS